MALMRNGNQVQARILVVSSEQTIALALSAILEEQGYAVATAFSGEQAVAKAAGFLPDVLLSEVCMSAMNGVKAASRITAMLPKCRVLFISGKASMSDILSFAPVCLIYSFMSRPLHPLDLLNAIAYMLPAASAADDRAAMAVAGNGIHRDAIGRMPGKTGLILNKTRTEALAAAQNKSDAMFFDIRLPQTAGFELRPQ